MTIAIYATCLHLCTTDGQFLYIPKTNYIDF